ncbi:DNA-directed DNA polymerase epsilon, subunit B [Mortierella sp. AM989]|nr:DNA-directed DNA polymerase epsilon, subunit B [Mortierella sp. AM989]
MRKNVSAAVKERALSIHIATDYTGPNGLPLVYGSTPDRVGTIKGTVRFSSNYECRGRDIAILYEAKAEARWTAIEHKKVVQHHTEEILGHHIWHFPLEHTKPGGKKIVPGSYEKEFEIPLIHPSLLNKSSNPSAAIHSCSTPTSTTQAQPVVLLPSSSDNPHAKMKYTIRAILRRPFLSIHNIEASQEVWVLQSSLPPPTPPKKPSMPRRVLSMTTPDHQSSPTTSLSTTPTPTASTPLHTSTALSEPPQPSTSDQESSAHLSPPPAASAPLVSLSTPTKVLKSAFAMLPSIDVLRPKRLLADSIPASLTPKTSSSPLAADRVSHEEPPKGTGPTLIASSDSSTSSSSTSESGSSLDSSISTSTGSPSRLSTDSSSADSFVIDEMSSSTEDDDDPANYTGVWEPFQIPYSCSLPSETVYLGQTVPVTIRFGPSKRSRKRQRDSRKKDRDGRKHGNHHHKGKDKYEQNQEPESPGYRFVVKKGILKVVEHTHLREVTVAPSSPTHKYQKQNPVMAPNNALNTFQSTNFNDKEPSPQHLQASNVERGGLLMIPGIAKKRSQPQIYQEKAYSGSHSHLYDHLQHGLHLNHQNSKVSSEDHQHERADSNDFKRFFKPKRHSVDVASRVVRATSPTGPRGPLSTTISSPTAQGFPPLPPSTNGASTRIINSIEAKFKTEVMSVSLTPQLQQRERHYQRRLDRDQMRSQEYKKESDNEEGDHKVTRRRDDGGNVWRTTIWIQIPGPPELATFTETKHIVKKHTLQLILLCGLVDDSGNLETEAEASATSTFGSVIVQPGINKEFRLEKENNSRNIRLRNPGLYGEFPDFEMEMEIENDNGLPDPERDLPYVTDHSISPLETLTKNFTIVTAASANHFCALESFLYSLSEVLEGLERTEVRPTLVVYNLGGMSFEQLEQLEYLKDNQYIDEYIDFDYDNYPDFWDINVARGEYGWKSGIIKEVADKYRGLTLWLDSGNMLALDFLRYLPGYLDKFGFWSPQSSGSFQLYTHPGLPQYYGDTIETYAQETNCNGAAIAFDASNDRIYNGLLKEWYTCSTIKECIAPIGSSRTNHRQDQAALTYLVKKMNFAEQCRHFPEHYGVTVHQDKVCRERIRAYKIMKGLDQEYDSLDDEGDDEGEEEEEETIATMSTPKARMMAIRRQIVRTFKKHQLTLQLDATEFLEETLENQNVPPEDLNDTLENIAAGYVAREGVNLVNRARLEIVLESMQKWTHHLHEKPTRNTLDPHKSQQAMSSQQPHHRSDPHELESIDMESMRHGINEMERDDDFHQDDLMDHELLEDNGGEEDDVDITELFHVIDAFAMPRWSWASDIKSFTRDESVKSKDGMENGHGNHTSGPNNPTANLSNRLLGTAEEKTAMFRARYHALLQRIMRNEHFAPPVFTGGMKQDRYLKLTPLKALKGRCGERFLMFGMLVKNNTGRFCLEDADDRVELEFNNCKNTAGLFTENCFVLVEGKYTDDNNILVDTIGLPPPELREETKKVFGNIDFLGAPREMRSDEQLNVIASEYEDISFVILSDLWLDQPKTFVTLRTIFEGYSNSSLPLAFIMCGSFKSEPFLFNGLESGHYRDGFNTLAELIAEFPVMATSSYFVFVPGPNDPWGSSIIPRPKIPDFYTARVRSLVKRSIFTSNPCRIKYCDQEIVIFRDDIMNRLLRNCIVAPAGDVVIQKQLVRTIASIRAPCCKLWFDCAECHAEATDHSLKKTTEMVFGCKKCKKVFRKDMDHFEEEDEYCPHCDNKYIVEAKIPKMALGVEGNDARMSERFEKDMRLKEDNSKSVFDPDADYSHLMG